MDGEAKRTSREIRISGMMLFVSCLASIGIGVWIGMALPLKSRVVEKVRTEIQDRVVTVTKTEFRTVEVERKTEDIEKEKVVVRKIAVPCRCQKTGTGTGQGSEHPSGVFIPTVPEGIGMSDGIGQLSFQEGYGVISEEITFRESSHTESDRKRQEEATTASRTDLGRNESSTSETIRESTDDWMVGIGIGYAWKARQPELRLEVDRRILGNVWVGVSGGIDRNLGGDVGAKVSMSF